MGYSVNLTDSTVVLEAKNQNEILQRWKELNKAQNNHLKSGGNEKNPCYAWMPANYDQTVESAQEVLELLGFDCSEDDNGDLHVVNYNSNIGDEKLFFRAIIDLIKVGSTMLWHGEDGANFAWYFDGKTILEMDLKEALMKAVKQMAEKENPPKKEVVQSTMAEIKKTNSNRYKNML